MDYQFKPNQEIVWAIVTAAVLAIAQILMEFDPATIGDWRFWAINASGAVARAIGAAIVAYVTKRAVS